MRTEFHEAMESLRREIARMAGLVAENLVRATHLLLEDEFELAEDIRRRDDDIDAIEAAVEERVNVLIARQQPAAGELRSLIAMLRLINDFERSGDLLLTVVKAAESMRGLTLPPEVRGVLQHMSDEAQFLLRGAIDAYVDDDLDGARSLEQADDRLDALTEQLYTFLFDGEGLERRQVMNLSLVARCFERIGDHAVAVGERVVFVRTGQIPSPR